MTANGSNGTGAQDGEIFEALSLIMSIGENHPLEHGRQVAWLTWKLVEELGLSLEEIGMAAEHWWYGALLHDIGEIYLSDRLLNKKGPLSSEQMAELRQHPVYGEQLLKKIPQLVPVSRVVRGHHERWDGSGYPDGLAGEAIPLAVQVVGLADCLSALISPRSYRPALTKGELARELENMAGITFNRILIGRVLKLFQKDSHWIDFIPEEYYKLSKLMACRIFKKEDLQPEFNEEVQGINLLSKVIDTKHLYTREHSQRVSNYAVLLAEKLGVSGEEIKKCRIAGLLHDAGKVVVPSYLLDKPGKLTRDEFQVIQGHPEMSFLILNTMSKYQDIAHYSRHHHERYDGNGYPDGLKGEEIPLISRIIGVVDAYDAMTSNRSYRNALDHETAIAEIEANSGTQFDPEIAHRFCRLEAEAFKKI